MYKVLGSKKNRGFRVLWMLEEIGQPYEVVPADPRSPEVIARNPSGKLPVLIDGDHAIPESSAILTYLGDRHGQFVFPCGTPERGMLDALVHIIADDFDACLWTAARHSFILPEDKRVPAIKPTLRWEFARAQGHMAARLGAGPFLMGETMTVADILLTHCLRWARGAKFELIPEMQAYLDRMNRRPALKRVEAL